MAIEIKELHIKFKMEPKQNADDAAGSSSSSTNGGNSNSANQHTLIATCVDEVLRILELKSEER